MHFLSDKILDFLEPAELERLFRGYFASLIKESTDTINNNRETKITDTTTNNNRETKTTDLTTNNQQKEPSKIADITNNTNNTNNQQKESNKIINHKSFVLEFVDQREIQRKRIQFRTTKISNHRTNVSLQNHPWKMPETKSRSLMCSLWEVLLVSSSQKYRCFECDGLLDGFTMYNITSADTDDAVQCKYPYKIYCTLCAKESKDLSASLHLNLKKTDRDKLKLLQSQNYRCKICNILVYPSVELDHKQPKAFGGSDKTTNLQNLCCECHRVKSLHESVMYGKDNYKTITSRIAEKLINNLKKIRE